MPNGGGQSTQGDNGDADRSTERRSEPGEKRTGAGSGGSDRSDDAGDGREPEESGEQPTDAGGRGTGVLVGLPQSAGRVSQPRTDPFDAGRQIVQPVERVADLNVSHLLELVDQRRERHPQILNGCFEGAGEQVLDGFPGVSELLAESDPPAHGPLRSPPEPFDDLPDSV